MPNLLVPSLVLRISNSMMLTSCVDFACLCPVSIEHVICLSSFPSSSSFNVLFDFLCFSWERVKGTHSHRAARVLVKSTCDDNHQPHLVWLVWLHQNPAWPAIQQRKRESMGSAASEQAPPPSQPRALGADPPDLRLVADLTFD